MQNETHTVGSRLRLQSQLLLSITSKGIAIDAKNTVKYLGAVLEECLFGANMATSLIQKANTRLKFYIESGGFQN